MRATQSLRQEPQNIVRDMSAFIWTVLEVAGSPSLREAATALYPGELRVMMPGDTLQHILLVAVAVLCDSAGIPLSGELAAGPSGDGFGASDVVRSARCLIAAVQQASPQELAEAHAYFLAPPWTCALANERPALTDLGFGVARFMIESATRRFV